MGITEQVRKQNFAKRGLERNIKNLCSNHALFFSRAKLTCAAQAYDGVAGHFQIVRKNSYFNAT